MPKKTRTKTREPKRLNGGAIPGNPGNSGGKKGRSGRKPDWFKAKCNTELQRPSFWKAVRQKAEDGDVRAMEFLAKYGQGLPTQTLKHEGGDSPVRFTLDFHANGDSDEPADD